MTTTAYIAAAIIAGIALTMVGIWLAPLEEELRRPVTRAQRQLWAISNAAFLIGAALVSAGVVLAIVEIVGRLT